VVWSVRSAVKVVCSRASSQHLDRSDSGHGSTEHLAVFESDIVPTHARKSNFYEMHMAHRDLRCFLQVVWR
jgi:hypothetical protein